MPTNPESYEWIVDAHEEAACVTVVSGSTPEAVLSALGGSVDELAADADDAYGECVLVTAVPGGVVAIEPNGFQGSLPEVLSRVAGDGRAASMFWNVNADNAFTWCDGSKGAEAGSVEMLGSGVPDEDAAYLAESDLPAELRELAALASDDDAVYEAVGVAMAVAFTGVDIGSEHEVNAGTYYRLSRG